MRTIKENVKLLISLMPSLIERENELLHAYWVMFDELKHPRDMIQATPAGSITRRLRELQNEHNPDERNELE